MDLTRLQCGKTYQTRFLVINFIGKKLFLIYPFKLAKKYLTDLAADSRRQMFAFGVVLFINYPLYYFIWLNTVSGGFESLTLRLIASALCLPLIFNKLWPKKKAHWLTLYWYVAACYCLPFFFTFMLLMNHGSTLWLMNSISVLFFVLLLFDLIASMVIIVIGAALGFLIFALLSSNEFFYHPGTVSLEAVLATFAAAIVIGSIFSRNKQVIEEVRRRSVKAEANSKAKSEFIANMSHDLRTPITGILGMVQDMLNTADHAEASLATKNSLKDASVLRNMIETVQRDGYYLMGATDELLQLCNEILEVVRLESGKLEDNVESFDIHSLITHNIDLLQPVARHKKLQLLYDIDNSVPQFLSGSRIYLDRVLLNLISNALKFTEEGSVKISAKLLHSSNPSISVVTGEEIRIKILVEDTGVGIPEDKFDTIFEHFSRLTPSYEGLYKGAGLGLYTVKRYIKAMDGRIDVSSKLNKGTCFTITLPFTVSDHADTIKQSIRSTKQIKQSVEKSEIKSEETDFKKDALASILLVEDHMLAAIAVTAVLKPFNCHIERAENGAQAVKMAEEGRYDLILMDIGLPDFSGIEATKKIRALNDVKKSQVPIVALTGHANNPEMRQEALEAGMQEVMSKPAQPLALESILQQFVFKAEAKEIDHHETAVASNDVTAELTIIDWGACVRMFKGDPEFTRNMLSMMDEDLNNVKRVLAEAYAKRDTKALREELHRCRGGVCYLKLPELECTLEKFHEAVKEIPQDEIRLEQTYAALQQAIENFKLTWKNDFK